MSEPSTPPEPGPAGLPALADPGPADRFGRPATGDPIGTPSSAPDPQPDRPAWESGPPPTAAVPQSVPQSMPQSVPSAPGRFVQLTYTSFDPDGGRGGGWRVHRTTGDPTPEEQQALVARIPTHTGIRDAGSGYLTAAQVDALPRRLVHGPTGHGGGTALWHWAPAGVDASGRPGNVFAHVLLDRTPEAPSPMVRPSDLLGSPEWLHPFGPDQVLATTLDAVPAPPWPTGPFAGYDAVAEFLREEQMWCGQLLAVLVDAVSGALSGSAPPVALVARTPRRAEQWIAALGRIMPAGVARRFYWSTDLLPAAGSDGPAPHLVVVAPAVADEQVASGGYVVIRDVGDDDRGGAAELGSAHTGEAHRTRDGAAVVVTAWSVLITEVAALESRSVVARVLARADEIAHRLGDPPDLGHAWPLAAACLDDESLASAQEDAAAVLTAQEPAGLARYPELRTRIRDLVDGAVGRTPQEALATAESGDLHGVSPGRACARYVELALQDWDWLVRPGGLPLPPEAHGNLAPDIGETAALAIDGILQRADTDARAGGDPRAGAEPPGVPAAVAAVRVLDLVRHYAIVDERFQIDQRLAVLAERVVAPLLLDPIRGPYLVDRVGHRPEPAVQPVREAVGRILGPGVRGAGDELVMKVHRWLNPRPPEPPAPGSLAAAIATLSPEYVDLVLQVTAVVARPQDHLPVALWVRMREARTTPLSELRRLAAAHTWTSPELEEFARYFDLGRIARQIRPWVLGLPWDERLESALHDVEGRIVQTGTQAGVDQMLLLDAARFRIEARRWTRGPAHGGYAGSVDRFLDAAERVLSAPPTKDPAMPTTAPPMAPEARSALQAACVVDVLDGIGPARPTVDRWMVSDPQLTADRAVVGQLHQALDHEVVAEERFLFAAIMAQIRPNAPELVELSDLAALTLPGGEPVMSRVLLERLQKHGRDASDLLETTEDFAGAYLRGNLLPRQADDAFTGLRREIQQLRRRAGQHDPDDTRPRRRSWPF